MSREALLPSADRFAHYDSTSIAISVTNSDRAVSTLACALSRTKPNLSDCLDRFRPITVTLLTLLHPIEVAKLCRINRQIKLAIDEVLRVSVLTPLPRRSLSLLQPRLNELRIAIRFLNSGLRLPETELEPLIPNHYLNQIVKRSIQANIDLYKRYRDYKALSQKFKVAALVLFLGLFVSTIATAWLLGADATAETPKIATSMYTIIIATIALCAILSCYTGKRATAARARLFTNNSRYQENISSDDAAEAAAAASAAVVADLQPTYIPDGAPF